LNEKFKSFGKIKKINVINGKSCAFVSYKNEQNAQFAKEAMSGQSLYGDENVLNIKWANEDPNPEAIKQRKRELEKETENVVRGLLENFSNVNKKSKIEDSNEPIVEEPEDDDENSDVEKETKQIEYTPEPNQQATKASVFDKSSLSYLSLLKRKEEQNPQTSLINGYESDDDDDDDE
jgi:hypothetical protein